MNIRANTLLGEIQEQITLPSRRVSELADLVDEASNEAMFDTGLADIEAGRVVPHEVVTRLSEGEPPVRVWREHRSLTQQVLAERAGTTKSYISQIETGAREPARKLVKKLAAALNIDPEDLLPWR